MAAKEDEQEGKEFTSGVVEGMFVIITMLFGMDTDACLL